MALYGVGLNVNVNRILQDLKLFVSKIKGGLNIRSLFNILESKSTHGHITPENLEKRYLFYYSVSINLDSFFLKSTFKH